MFTEVLANNLKGHSFQNIQSHTEIFYAYNAKFGECATFQFFLDFFKDSKKKTSAHILPAKNE